MDTLICGMQQFGVGVTNVVEAYNWYAKAFGTDIKVTDAFGVAERMLPYTGGKPRARRAIIAVNLQGGGGLEIWEPKDNNITPQPAPAVLGDLGTIAGKIRALDVDAAYAHLSSIEGARMLAPVSITPYGKKHFFMYDPYENLFEVVQDDYLFQDCKMPTGGANGAIIGVTDMDKSVKFYGDLLGFDKVILDETGLFADFEGVPGAEGRFRRVLLGRNVPMQGPLSEVYGPAYIELVQAFDRVPVKLYEGRWWGDPGFIQICFDIHNMEGIHERALALGHDFVCDGGVDFQMGDTDGHFTYVEDPDGTLIEFVETFKITLVKKLGLAINLRNKDPHKFLPRWMTKGLRFLRAKSIK